MSDTSTSTTDTSTATAETPDTGDQDRTDWKAEAEKWQAMARKHEDRAKANASAAKELEQVRQASMSDLEKAVAIAKAEARTEALREAGTRLVDAEVKAAAAGRSVDVEALLEGLDRSRFLGEDGEPDSKAIATWVDRIAPKSESTTTSVDFGQGARPGATTALNDDALVRDLSRAVGAS